MSWSQRGRRSSARTRRSSSCAPRTSRCARSWAAPRCAGHTGHLTLRILDVWAAARRQPAARAVQLESTDKRASKHDVLAYQLQAVACIAGAHAHSRRGHSGSDTWQGCHVAIAQAPAPAVMAKPPVKGHSTASVRAASDSKPPLPGKAKVGKRKTADPDD